MQPQLIQGSRLARQPTNEPLPDPSVYCERIIRRIQVIRYRITHRRKVRGVDRAMKLIKLNTARLNVDTMLKFGWLSDGQADELYRELSYLESAI